MDTVPPRQPQVSRHAYSVTTTMRAMQATIEALTESGPRGQVKVLIGGAPVAQGFATRIRADGFRPMPAAPRAKPERCWALTTQSSGLARRRSMIPDKEVSRCEGLPLVVWSTQPTRSWQSTAGSGVLSRTSRRKSPSDPG